jgi:glycosyltransferase 2 family protein
MNISSTKGFKQNLYKIISIFLSIIVIIIIYTNIDLSNFIEIFSKSDIPWLIVSIIMVIPTTFLTTVRFKQLIPDNKNYRFFNLLGLILSAGTMNIILPSKMGDIAKAFFMKNTTNLKASQALSIVIFEKVCDLLALILFCLFGLISYSNNSSLFWVMRVIVIAGLIFCLLLLSSRKLSNSFFRLTQRITRHKFKEKINNMSISWSEMQNYFFQDKLKLSLIVLNSILIWFLHLLQIWFFILALNLWVPFKYNIAFASLSILVGLLPISIAGIGTRDAAIIFFYKPFIDPASGAALGILFTTRYLMPAIIGLPFFSRYLSKIKDN